MSSTLPAQSPAPVWLFDVDGTLTPPQGVIAHEFSVWFQRFALANDTRIVSGGDRERILRQLGRLLVGTLSVSYNSLGNSVWVRDVEVHRLEFEPPAGLEAMLLNAPELSAYPGRRQSRLTWKNGMLAFTLLGPDATVEERTAYREFDDLTGVRRRLAERIRREFPGLTGQVAGETSVDIFPQGCDKAQVLGQLAGPVYFFADRTAPGGNDHSLAEALRARTDGSQVFTVQNWNHTWALLRHLTEPVASSDLATAP